MWATMQAGLASGIRPTTRGPYGRGCWGRTRWRITRCTEIELRPKAFLSLWGEVFIRRGWGVSARYLGATHRFLRRGVLLRPGAWRKRFAFGSFWLHSRGSQK